MFGSLKQRFQRRRQIVERRPLPSEDYSENIDNLPPGYMPIESSYDTVRIPGTMIEVGTISRVFQTPNNEIVTIDEKKGVPLACGHDGYYADETVTPNGKRRGIGGVCPDCASEAGELLRKDAISIHQAEAMSRYCTQCASSCESCRRHNICIRHTREFQHPDGHVQILCPDCLKKAQEDKFFNSVLGAMLTPLIDNRQRHNEGNNHHAY